VRLFCEPKKGARETKTKNNGKIFVFTKNISHIFDRLKAVLLRRTNTMSSKEEDLGAMKKQRDVVLNRLEDVREELRRVLVENAQQTHPRAKVKARGTDVLVVDKERFEKLERQSKEEVAKAKRKVSEKIERLEREAEEIKRECFDGM